MGYTRPAGRADGERVRSIRNVLWGILGLNLLVAAAKLGYGMLSRSVSMTADGFHSMFDGTSNVIGLLGMGMAGRPADDDHPYGHAKYETFAEAAIAVMLLVAAWRVGSTAVAKLLGHAAPARVDAGSFAVMLGTLAINIGVAVYERRAGSRLGSDLLVADATHTGSDVFVSIGVIIGLIAVKLGLKLADPVMGLVVAGAILLAAVRVFKSAGATLSDQARIATAEVCEAALSVPGVLGCHGIRTRGTAAEIYVDLHIQVDPSVSVAAGHAIAEVVEKTVCEHFSQVKDVIAHLEPMDDYERGKTERESGGGTR